LEREKNHVKIFSLRLTQHNYGWVELFLEIFYFGSDFWGTKIMIQIQQTSESGR
jgi:hypothetical protein